MTKHKLNISEKNFLYNLILTLLICALIFSYMAFYMPQVYLEKKTEAAQEDVLKVHESFVKNKSYKGLDSLVKEGMYSYYIPKGENDIYFSSLRLNTSITVKNQKLAELLRYMEEDDFKDIDIKDFKKRLSPLANELKGELGKFFEINKIDQVKTESDDRTSIKILDDAIFMNFSTKSQDTLATNLIVLSKKDSGTYVSFYPFIFSSIKDIKSTVFAAFPVIFLFVVIIVFLLNRVYSKSITEPIIKMTNFTRKSKYEKSTVYDLDIRTKDEIEELSENLKSLYETLTENYKDLEKNSKRREIFIKSTSHELKTPLQSAILLNESMIAKMGKYEDRDKYLPKLRENLYKLQVLIDDLLYMNKIDEDPILEDLDLALIMKEAINNHQDLLDEKNISAQVLGEKISKIDYSRFKIIFDNLLKNAIENTEKGGSIESDFTDKITISNGPTSVKTKDLDVLFDPFVSEKKSKSKGMGLYIVKYLLEDMGFAIELSYKEGKFVVEIS